METRPILAYLNGSMFSNSPKVAETKLNIEGFSHRLRSIKIMGHFLYDIQGLASIHYVESVTFQVHDRMLSSSVATSLKVMSIFRNLGLRSLSVTAMLKNG